METFLEIFWIYFDRAMHIKVDAWVVAISSLFVAGVSVRAYRFSLLTLNDMQETHEKLNQQLLLLQNYRHHDTMRSIDLSAEVALYAKFLNKNSYAPPVKTMNKKNSYDLPAQHMLYKKIKIYKNSINLLHGDITQKYRNEFYRYIMDVTVNFPADIAKTGNDIMHLFMLILLYRQNLSHLLDINEASSDNAKRENTLLNIENKMIQLLNQLESQMRVYFSEVDKDKLPEDT